MVEAALEAALSLLPGPAFAFDADGQVLAANVTVSDDHLTRARACLRNPDQHRARLARRDPATVVLLVETERDAALARANQRWRLTPKQSETLGHLVSGASNKEIATLLDCSLSNVEGDHRGVLGGAIERASGRREGAVLYPRDAAERREH